jgi:anti-anti-sigma factor
MRSTLAVAAARLYARVSRNGDGGAQKCRRSGGYGPPVAERLALEMEQLDGGVVLRLTGRLDAATVPVLTGALRAVDEGRHGAVLLDLEHVTEIDGAGIGLLLEAESAALAGGRAFEVSGLQASLRRRVPVGPWPAQPTELDGATP